MCVVLGKIEQTMRSKTLIKECNCIHCLEKQEQINRSREYWTKVITNQVKSLL